MFAQPENTLELYDLTVQGVTKGRGYLSCQTDKGVKVLQPFAGQEARAKKLANLLEYLREQDPSLLVEEILPTREGKLLVTDEEERRHLLKTPILGTEHTLFESSGRWKEEECVEAVKLLARIHMDLKNYPWDGTSATIDEVWEKQIRLLIKVRNYIRNKRSRNEFERIYQEFSPHYIEQAREAAEGARLLRGSRESVGICHGDVNNHNFVVTEEGMALVNFESSKVGWWASDLVNYIRKLMEKCGYNFAMARELIEAYDSVRVLSQDEKMLIYIQFLFPEKYYKVTSRYDNSKKVWTSQRDMEKLLELVEGENARGIFLTNLFSFISE